ncbi:protein STICHEL-like 3 isoform X2 [Phoenix dactylifera]|uniref:Protein STICHEL-like 3 isoform X2 n=2 Tax=Phoenix dactylifera TaxID=42345 RepID=A0A8B9AN87_PHODC|nr:protein STICHEL-like 3 isoform X2 [Phoenix dactylifera]
MTRAVRGNFLKDDSSAISNHLKDEYGAISDHLRYHVHLTNCIHLKNHMHHHSPNPAERSLMRDLIVLQKSRSLRDPSTSPPSWFSPSTFGSYPKRPAKDGAVQSGRRSIGADGRREAGRLSASSPLAAGVATSKVAAADSSSGHNIAGGDMDAEISKGEEHSRKSRKSDISHGSENPPLDLPQKVEAKDKRISQRVAHGRAARLMTLSEQLEEVAGHTDNERRNPPHLSRNRIHTGEEIIHEEPEASSYGHCNGLKSGKRRRFRGMRKARGSTNSRSMGTQNNMSSGAQSLAQVSMHQKGYTGEGPEEDAELEFARAPRHVCGIPWNWSRIHHRGRTFLDMAGRSLSCGLSDSRLRKAEGPVGQRRGNTSNMPQIAPDHLSSSTSSDSEAQLLLVEASGSQDSDVNPYLTQDYSGELGIFSNHSLRHEDSDLASEARSGNQQKFRGCRHGRHRSLTQKYMPRTFKDLVGQNLVVQALSNAVLRKKVGLIYVFYGPHGTGKTSCARVFAKALNCQSMEHPKPCDACASCISHNLGKSRNVLEVGPVGNFNFESIVDVLDNVMLSPLSSQYRVFIVDDCDTLPPNSWNVISRIIDRAPRHVVFILVRSNLDHLPHIIISRCQKFFFPKLKDSDIISTLQWISTSEGLEIDKDALKLIASRSDGSLRDAEMTLDQLSLLGQRISLSLVQELVGLVSDEKLVDLLDLALSADTVNTVKTLREIMETGVEPLALMSQLATVITDILAGSYIFTRERLRRKFFRRLTLSKEDMEKLRQALKTLSEAEKQLRVSNDKLTWLTAALLQLAPDQQYMLPSSSADTSLNHSPLVLNNYRDRGKPRNFTNEQDEMHICDRDLSRGNGTGNHGYRVVSVAVHGNNKVIRNHLSGTGHGEQTSRSLMLSSGATKAGEEYNYGKTNKDNDKIWRAVLENVQSNMLRQFLYQDGRLISVSLGTAPTVQLLFSSDGSKSKAEKFRGQILQAFESVLSSAVILEIRCESRKDGNSDVQNQHILPAPENGSSQMMKRQSITNQRSLDSGSEKLTRRLPKENGIKGIGSRQGRWLHTDPHVMAEGEIIETGASPLEHGNIELTNNTIGPTEKALEGVWVQEPSSSQHQANLNPLSKSRQSEEQYRRQSLVRGKVSLAHVIQQAEGCSQRGGWSRRKAISIAEKLEQENLRLEPRSRSLLCWKASRITQAKLSNLRVRTRRPRSLLKLVTCGRCLRARSPRKRACRPDTCRGPSPMEPSSHYGTYGCMESS